MAAGDPIINGKQVDITAGKVLTVTENATISGTPIANLVEDTTPQLGGNLDLNGKTVTVTETVFFPIGYGIDGAAPPESKSTLASTNKVDVRNFDDATDEDVFFVWQVPHDLTGSTVTFRVITFVTQATGPSTEGVAFFMQGASLGDGDILSSALGTAVKSSYIDQTHAQYDRIATTYSAAVTITDLLAGETAILKLYRDVSDADDDYGQDIGVFGLEVKYSRALSNS